MSRTMIYRMVIACSAAALVVGAEKQVPQSVADALEEFRTAKDAGERVDAEETILEFADIDFLRKLRFHENDDVAIWAAFQVLLRGKRVNEHKDQVGFPEFRFRPQDTARFAGFVEGRLGIPVPAEWENAFQNAVATDWGPDWGRVGIGGDDTSMLKRFRKQFDCWVPKSQVLEVKDDKLYLKIGSHSFLIPKSVLEENDSRYFGFSGVSRGESAVIVLAGYFPVDPSPIICVDQPTGEMIWRQTIWAHVAAGSSSGPPPPHVTLPVIHGDAVYVFGVSINMCYLEAFQLKDGKPLVRFSSGY